LEGSRNLIVINNGNYYAGQHLKKEITNHVEVIPPNEFNLVGIRFFLHLPVTVDGKQVQGPFMHGPRDNDSSAVTFWQTWPDELRKLLQTALDALDQYENSN
jgi:hypothetical protein